MVHYKDCLVNLSRIKDADIICYFSTFKRKSDIIKSIELMIGCVKLGMPVPKSYKLNDNYRDKVEDSRYRFNMKPEANDFFVDIKDKVNKSLNARYKKTDVLKALVRLSLIYPEGDIQPLDNQILMNYIEGNGSNTRDVQQSNFSDISNEKLEEHKAEALNDNLKDKKTEKTMPDTPESEPVYDKKEIIKAESDTRKADKGEDKEPESSRESYDDININFESSGKVVEEKSIVNTQSNGIVNMFRRF